MGNRFKNEADFEDYLRTIIKDNVVKISNSNLKILKNRGIADIVICRHGKYPSVFFIECKFHKIKHGRIGFGSAKSSGIQPEILSNELVYFESNLRWAIAHEDNEGVVFEPSSFIKDHVSGGSVEEKYNITPAILWI
jgi:hypothetical protein